MEEKKSAVAPVAKRKVHVKGESEFGNQQPGESDEDFKKRINKAKSRRFRENKKKKQLVAMATVGMDYVQIPVSVVVSTVIVELRLHIAILESIIIMAFLLHSIQTQTPTLHPEEELVTMV